jgi:HlyD family secretion protein
VRRKIWLVAGGTLALVVVVVASVRSGARGETLDVYAAAVSRRGITQTVRASGQINPRVKVNISAHVIGKIEELYVREGDAIEAGKPFLRLEQQAFLAARDDARARLAMAETELRRAEVALADQAIRLERADSLHRQGIASKEALESAQLQHSSAELQLRSAHEGVSQARALLEKADDDLRKTTIYAPIGGRVIALNAEQGEVVVSGTMNNPASVIGTIADLSEVLAEVDVDETEIVDVRPGLAATVEVDALPDARYEGRVVEVGSSGYAKPQQPDVQFFRVKILLERPDERLRPGMSARAEVRVTTHDDALVVPIQAVVERPPLASAPGAEAAPASGAGEEEVPIVFALDERTARQRAVRTGISDTTHVEILEGVAEGDKVVTGPYRALKKLKDGDLVKVTVEKKNGAGTGRADEEQDEAD